MPRVRIFGGTAGKSKAARHEFTVLLLPIFERNGFPVDASKEARARRRNPLSPSGYQVTVPAWPGLLTFGRTEAEALAMAQDAIQCHVEGLKKDGEQIPSESAAQFRKLLVSA